MHVAPPLKKQRHLTSTSHPQSPVDIQTDRDASKHRSIGVRSNLAERYTRPINEDDILDINTAKITTDRGIIRNSRKISFGAVAAPSAEDVATDEGTDEDDEEDELDAFADTTTKADNAAQSEKELPVTGLGLTDVEDLRASERTRKDLCGNEVEEDDYSTDSGPAGTEDLHSFLAAEHNIRTGKDLRAGKVKDLEDDSRPALDSASEDELNNWDADISNLILKQGDDDSDSDREIIEGPILSLSKSTSTQKLANKSQDQLQTRRSLNNSSTSSSNVKPLTPRKSALDSASEAELNNWDADVSNVVLKQGDDDNDSDIEIIEGPILSPSKSTSLQKLANKSQDQLQTRRSLNNSSTSSSNVKPLTPRKSTSLAKSKTKRRDFTSKSSISGSGSESGAPYRSPNSPRRKQQRHPLPPETFVPPLPDPRAQFIITQALQQLSALVGTPWTPPHDSFILHTPSWRQESRCNPMFNTPTYHPYQYPYFYNPNLSLATLPPESPESVSSPEKSSHRPRKSSIAGSYSRGKRVSFKIDDDGSDDDDRPDSKNRVNLYSSPSKPPLRRAEAVREQRRQSFTLPSKGKGKAKAEAPDSDSSSEDPLDCGSDTKNGKSYSRGRTLGPKFGPPKDIKPRQDLKGKLI